MSSEANRMLVARLLQIQSDVASTWGPFYSFPATIAAELGVQRYLAGDSSLPFVVTGIGFGKTHLILSRLRTSGHRYRWLSLDRMLSETQALKIETADIDVHLLAENFDVIFLDDTDRIFHPCASPNYAALISFVQRLAGEGCKVLTTCDEPTFLSNGEFESAEIYPFDRTQAEEFARCAFSAKLGREASEHEVSIFMERARPLLFSPRAILCEIECIKNA